MRPIGEGTLLWTPSEDFRSRSNMARYMRWLADRKGVRCDDYASLWEWSVSHVEDFWASVWEFFEVRASRQYERVLSSHEMPGARWFEGAELNYVEHALRDTGNAPAIVFRSELRPLTVVGREELREQVASVASALREMGVGRGDRVVAYLPNVPEAVVAFLATASLGAIWSSCSPDFGSPSVLDRFYQIEPKVLFAVDGYSYGGKPFDRRGVVRELRRSLPTLERTVLVPYLQPDAPEPGTLSWRDVLRRGGTLELEQVPFEHPLWVLYSSGTTGLPKAIVQSHGGILLEHLRALSLHHDLGPGDRFFWFTTTGWMMWNYLVSGLAVGSTILLYDGSPAWPDHGALWRFAEEAGMTLFGTSAAYIASCAKQGVEPGRDFDLGRLRSVGSTGSPLPPEGFAWVYEHVRRDLWLASASGGTDLCTAFLTGCALLPVRAGEIQCRALGAKVEAFDEEGRSVVGETGELVITEPMPSMPICFWNDPDGRRYRESYFEMYPGVWRHGDWVRITPAGGAFIYGRSDSTINRQGIRIGSSEIYSAVEGLPEVLDSLVVGLERPGGGYYMPLFVVLREGATLDDDLRERIRGTIRGALSARQVPDEILQIEEVPRTLSGKKLEVPVKRILMGMPLERAANPDSTRNPRALEYFVELARKLAAAPA